MDLYTTLFELIDMRSFSNLWYWIGLAVLWSSASFRVLGIPFDMIQKARRQGGQAMEDLETIVRVYVRRIVMITDVSGLWIMGFVSFLLTVLGVLAFGYAVEFAQAVFLMAAPMSVVALMALISARRIDAQGLAGEALVEALLRQRFWTQVIGVLAIFVTAMWGMYQNLMQGAL